MEGINEMDDYRVVEDAMPSPEDFDDGKLNLPAFVSKGDREIGCESVLDGRKLIQDWADVYFSRHGKRLNLATLRKRRFEAKVGMHVPPHAWYLTWDEFIEVMNTPLAYCNRVRDIH